MVAPENPHCGVSGVPFINSTTGAVPTALSIAAFVSDDRSRICKGVQLAGKGLVTWAASGRDGLDACRKAFAVVSR